MALSAPVPGLIGDVVGWLILIGLLVPPIGGAIIADYYVIRGDRVGFSVERGSDFNWAAIIAVIAGVIIGYWVNQTYPTFLFGVAGIASSFVIYIVLANLRPTHWAPASRANPPGPKRCSHSRPLVSPMCCGRPEAVRSVLAASRLYRPILLSRAVNSFDYCRSSARCRLDLPARSVPFAPAIINRNRHIFGHT